MPDTITLSTGRKIGPGEPCFIAAEIGQNHQGDVYTALRLAKVAHEAGVDAIKLCKQTIEAGYTADFLDQPYCGPQSFGDTYGLHRHALELCPNDFAHLKERLRYNDWPEILFATVCDREAADVVRETLDPPLYKIASRDLTNLPLLDYVAAFRRPMVLSTGMAWHVDIDQALETIHHHHDQVILLHCVAAYPAKPEEMTLGDMDLLRKKFGVPVGLSDHTPGIVTAQAAAALGACMIEKHITLSRAMRGSDHAASLEPDGIAKLVRNIRVTESAMRPVWLGDIEKQARLKLGRSIVSSRDIRSGEIVTEEHLCLKSPGTGMAWSERHKLLGKRASRALRADMILSPTDVDLVEAAA